MVYNPLVSHQPDREGVVSQSAVKVKVDPLNVPVHAVSTLGSAAAASLPPISAIGTTVANRADTPKRIETRERHILASRTLDVPKRRRHDRSFMALLLRS
jgi:hypothetical protein